MSEHTAEYVLVTDLIRRLSNIIPCITPFFFWASREGQTKAQSSYGGTIRLLGAYARRPKVTYAGETTIQIKFNELLFHHAFELKQAGVPLLAGVPCVSRLSDLRLNSLCAWFRIEAKETEWNDVFATVNLDDPMHARFSNSDSSVQGPLSTKEIHELIFEHSRIMLWSDALDRLREVGRNLLQGRGASSAWYGRYLRYKPFYLAMLNRENLP